MRDFGKILAENRKKKGYSQAELAELLSQEGIQVTTKAISKWETNAREPSLHVFLKLCLLLDIEDIYESFFGENPYNIMSGLNEAGRNKLIEFAGILKASNMFARTTAKIIPFRHPVEIFWEPVSAGTGNYLEDSAKEIYDVGHLAPEQTDFGVRISGDSMEPLYHTGDVAWIHKKDSIANGEVGIFYLNGNTYIKKLHDEPDGVYLISLNEKYQPIHILETDSFKIFGKVIGKCKGTEIPGFQ